MEQREKEKALEIMEQRFGCDTLIALATTAGEVPFVRAVNSYYEDGSFYVITHALSDKMKQLGKNPRAAICGDWFTGHALGESLGWIRLPENADLADKLRTVFDEWYDNGHVDESDENTVILKLRLTDCTLADHGTWYQLDFTDSKE